MLHHYIIRIIKSKYKLGGASSMHGRGWKYYKILIKHLNGRDHLKDLGVDGRILLESILWK
jgi:hypothetical protein